MRQYLCTDGSLEECEAPLLDQICDLLTGYLPSLRTALEAAETPLSDTIAVFLWFDDGCHMLRAWDVTESPELLEEMLQLVAEETRAAFRQAAQQAAGGALRVFCIVDRPEGSMRCALRVPLFSGELPS